jgi:hypothetical protein
VYCFYNFIYFWLFGIFIPFWFFSPFFHLRVSLKMEQEMIISQKKKKKRLIHKFYSHCCHIIQLQCKIKIRDIAYEIIDTWETSTEDALRQLVTNIVISMRWDEIRIS